jgi:type I restriction enzyme, R subunit
MDAMSAHESMSKQALGSERVQAGILSTLLGPGALWQALRSEAANPESQVGPLVG